MTTGPQRERVNVALITKAASSLAELRASTGMSVTDLVNRSIQLYAFVQGELDKGHELAIHLPASGDTRVVHVA